VRLYNLSSCSQQVKLTFFETIAIKHAEIVNLLEEIPKNQIKAKLLKIERRYLELKIEAHVIATIKIDFLNS
jgi:hypothetical protein